MNVHLEPNKYSQIARLPESYPNLFLPRYIGIVEVVIPLIIEYYNVDKLLGMPTEHTLEGVTAIIDSYMSGEVLYMLKADSDSMHKGHKGHNNSTTHVPTIEETVQRVVAINRQDPRGLRGVCELLRYYVEKASELLYVITWVSEAGNWL